MSGSTYRGDSPGKKVARARLWMNTSIIMTELGVPYHGAFVLAGEGGDISTLKALGFNPKTIIAVDIDPEYSDFCAELYPGVVGLSGEAGRIARTRIPGLYYNSAHLDFCNGLTLENIETFADVCLGAASLPAVINVTMMKGREASSKRNKNLIPNMSRSQRRFAVKLAKKRGDLCGTQILKSGRFDPKIAIERAKHRLAKKFSRKRFPAKGFTGTKYEQLVSVVKKNGELTSLGNGMARIDALTHCAEYLLNPLGYAIFVSSCYCYHSKSKDSNGTPFVSANIIVCSVENHGDLIKFIYGRGDAILCFESLPGGDSKEALRHAALCACRGIPTAAVAELFDISKDTVAAWRAHETRGTYGKEEDDPKFIRSVYGISKLERNDLKKYQSTGWGNLVVRGEEENESQ